MLWLCYYHTDNLYQNRKGRNKMNDIFNDFFSVVGAFLLYWLVGWGILLAGIGFIVWLIVKTIKSTSSNAKKGFNFFGVVVLAIAIGFLFNFITHSAIDIDPNRDVKEDVEFEKQLD